MDRARPFLVCFEAHAKDDRVWAVRFGRKWHRTRSVSIGGGAVLSWVSSVYRGPKARQPRAYFAGRGWMLKDAQAIRLWPE
jgi:hypothetical protein